MTTATRRPRPPRVTQLVEDAQRAGLTVERIERLPDGTIRLYTAPGSGEGDPYATWKQGQA